MPAYPHACCNIFQHQWVNTLRSSFLALLMCLKRCSFSQATFEWTSTANIPEGIIWISIIFLTTRNYSSWKCFQTALSVLSRVGMVAKCATREAVRRSGVCSFYIETINCFMNMNCLSCSTFGMFALAAGWLGSPVPSVCEKDINFNLLQLIFRCSN